MNKDVTTENTKGTKNKAYPKYKPSGVKWLGNVPEHWGVKRLKYQVTINDETLPETTDPDFELLYVDISSVNPSLGIVQKESLLFENAPSRARRIVRNGDTIVSTVRTYLRAISPVIDPESNLIVSTGFAVIRPRKINQDYLSAAIQAPYFIEEVVSRSVGVSYPAINASEIGLISIPLPPFPEQQAIAAFLDRDTGRIDSLIAKKQLLLELLAEQRAALIFRAVTKGLDATVKLKPSGVEWLGDVPEHWGVKKIVFLLERLQDGTHFSPESDFSGEYLYITAKNIKEWGLDLSEITYVSQESHREIYKRCPVKKGDVLYIKDGATAGIATVNKLDEEFSMLSSVAMLRARNQLMDSRFLTYHLNMKAFKNFALNSLVGGAMTRFTIEIISRFRIITPPLPEQQAIAAFLDRETAKIDTLSAKVVTVIERLKEYRTALISSAVTGKINVREAV